MKVHFTLPALVLAICSATSAMAGPIAWGHNFQEALHTARTQHKLVMVDFYTSWCTWCKHLDKVTYPSAVVQKAMQQVIPVKLNAETNGSKAAQTFHVSAYPYIAFVTPTGKLVNAIVGFEPPTPFANDISKIVSTFTTFSKELPGLNRSLTQSPPNPKLLQNAIREYTQVCEFHKATSAANRLKSVDYSAYPSSLEVIAEAYENIGRYGEAQPIFRQVIAKASDVNLQAQARVNLALTFLEQGSGGPAKNLLKEVAGNPKVSKSMRTSALSILKEFSS